MTGRNGLVLLLVNATLAMAQDPVATFPNNYRVVLENRAVSGGSADSATCAGKKFSSGDVAWSLRSPRRRRARRVDRLIC